MRDVEQRLGQPDTGEETRKKQGEIVQDLESILKQLRNSLSGDSEGGADLLEGVARLAGILDRLPKLGFRRIDCGSRL